MSQTKWTQDIVNDFTTVCVQFVSAMKRFLWRHRSQLCKDLAGDEKQTNVPLPKPKFRTLLVNLVQFVSFSGFWGVLSEESFRRFQHKSLSTRRLHAHNRSNCVQIIDDIMYSWVLVSPRARKVRSEAEKILLKHSSNVRVEQFD